MLYVREKTQVRVPAVYAVYTATHKEGTEDITTYYLISEFIPGHVLNDEMRLRIGAEGQTRIASKFAEQLQKLRVALGVGYYGRVHHQGFSPDLNWLSTRYDKMCGPYETYEEFVDAKYAEIEFSKATEDSLDWRPSDEIGLPQYKSKLLSFKDISQPMLTYTDIKAANTIVQEVLDAEGRVVDWNVVLIDWKHVGFLPAWMQSSAVWGFEFSGDERFQTILVQMIIDTYDKHHADSPTFRDLTRRFAVGNFRYDFGRFNPEFNPNRPDY
jgi:hypothetical protein